MKEDKLKIAQEDIDEALSTIEKMELELDQANSSKEALKERFIFLAEKVKELESVLKDEGIL